MREFQLGMEDDAVRRLAAESQPAQAVVELIWNAIDAEADLVQVEFDRTDTGAIDVTRVIDDGHGISPDEVEAVFGHVGGSWKARPPRKSKNRKRGLHGENGQGRLRAFALGSRIRWESTATDTAGVTNRVVVSADRTQRHKGSWETSPIPGPRDPGTTVTLWNDEQRNLNSLDTEATYAHLVAAFAPALMREPNLQITYDTKSLDPAEHVLHDNPPQPVTFDGGQVWLHIIEWKSGKERHVYFGSDDTHFAWDESAKELDSQYPYSAYVTWIGASSEVLSQASLHDGAVEPVASMWTAVRDAVREHFDLRRHTERRLQISEWKDQGLYPYEGQPTTEAERVERAVFDVVSGTLANQISTSKDPARLTLALLRDAIRHDPERLTTILNAVIKLKPEDRESLTGLLAETTLPAIIRNAGLVSDRTKFLASLDRILFDPSDSKVVGERDHLHKILLHELWVFGEEYSLMNSERGLTQLARTHLKLTGLPDTSVKPVKRSDGTSGRVDLHLAVSDKEHGRLRYLVVELKAPSVKLSSKEVDQAKSYADTIREAGAFANGDSEWDVLLVGTEFDRRVSGDIESGRRPDLGLVYEPQREQGHPKVRVFVRTWRAIIDQNRQRLDFVSQNLNLDPSLDEGMRYVREHYADLLPPEIAEPDESTPAEGA
jgi:hypothetical protein